MTNIIMERLKLLDVRPRWHGNGFVQLQLDEHHRLHVWGATTKPRFSNNARIHNHTWGTDSVVLFGNLSHTVYRLHDYIEGSQVLYEVEGHDFRELGRVEIEPQGLYQMAVGSRYSFPRGAFHETRSTNAMTIIRKRKMDGDEKYPRVIAPYGEEPYDAHDDTMMSDHAMWVAIESALIFTDEWGQRQLMEVLKNVTRTN